ARASADAGGARRAGPQAQNHRRHLDRCRVRCRLRVGALGQAHPRARRGCVEPALRHRAPATLGAVRAGAEDPQPPPYPFGPADITIAIDVSGAPTAPGKRPHPSAFAALMASSQIMQRTIVREKLKVRQPDIYIDVEVDDYYVLDFHRFKQILADAAPAQAQ